MKQLAIFICISFSSLCFANREKPIVVVIPSYNNAQWYERNLNSVCFQNYKNYRIIYIDDCSPDGTGKLVQAYSAKHKLQDKVTLICNETNCGAMANHYKAVWMCADDEIIVHLDGDDFLKHTNVLARINREYQNADVWLTYGQFECFPGGKVGFCREMPKSIIQRNIFREYEWITSHLRTFYAGLFKQIKLRDFVHDNRYFDMTCDMAMMFPLLELAGTHMRFIPDVLYVYNEATPINDYKKNVIRQLHCEKTIRSKTKYQPASSYTVAKRTIDPIDVVIFAADPQAVDALITRILSFQEPVNGITVFYNEADAESFAPLCLMYADIEGIACLPGHTVRNYFEMMCQYAGYFVLITDDFELTEPMALTQAVNALEATRAFSFNFALGENVTATALLERLQKQPSFVKTPQDCLGWQFADAEYDWRQPFACTMNLCRKSDIKKMLEGAHVKNFAEFRQVLQRGCVDLYDMGLCYARSRAALIK